MLSNQVHCAASADSTGIRRTGRGFAIIIAAVVLAGVPIHAMAQGGPLSKPEIQSATISITTNQIAITGANLESAKPLVSLDGIPLTLLSWAPTAVSAAAPSNVKPLSSRADAASRGPARSPPP